MSPRQRVDDSSKRLDEQRNPAHDMTPPPLSKIRQTLAGTVLVLCLALVMLATMWPTPLDQGYATSIDRVLQVLHRNGVPEWFGYTKLEFSANVLMFVPIGFLLTMILPMRVWWLALVVGCGLSISIELIQGAVLTARFATVSDVVSNSIGTVVGAFLAVIIRSLVYSRDQKLIARALWQLQLR